MKRDYYAGALMALIGCITGYNAIHHPLGTLLRMGPGMFPLALSCILIGLGLLIAVTASDGPDEVQIGHDEVQTPDPRGCIAIIAGMLAFVVLTHYFGIVPGTFACVLISALGDKDATALGSFVLAASVTLIGTLVFVYGLKMNLPLFKWFVQ